MSRTSAPGDLCACRPWPVQPECCCEDWPLPWPIPDSTGPDDLSPDQKRALWAQAAASQRLSQLTAFRWGLCEDTVRPCGPMVCQPKGSPLLGWGYGMGLYGSGLPIPYVSGGQMYNCMCGCDCDGCDVRCTIPLPGPVHQVLEVTVGGAQLVEDVDWMVNGEGGLVALGDCWPHEQDMRAPCGDAGSFCVRYLRGINPAADLGAIRAVSLLACRLFHDACGTGDCPSLRDATRVSRGNVEWQRDSSRIGAGFTGLPVVDDWVDLVNPNGQRQVPRVYSPDVRKWKFHGYSERRRTIDPGDMS